MRQRGTEKKRQWNHLTMDELNNQKISTSEFIGVTSFWTLGIDFNLYLERYQNWRDREDRGEEEQTCCLQQQVYNVKRRPVIDMYKTKDI